MVFFVAYIGFVILCCPVTWCQTENDAPWSNSYELMQNKSCDRKESKINNNLTNTSEAETHINLNVRQSRQKKNASPLRLLGILKSMPHCVRRDPTTNKALQLLSSFRVANVSLCWEYCSHGLICKVFSYHFLTQQCYIFNEVDDNDGEDVGGNSKDDDVDDMMSDKDLVSYSRQCLQCPRNVNDLFDQEDPDMAYSKATGVFITDAQSWYKCLTVTNCKMDGMRDRLVVTWGECSKSSLWILSRLDYANFGGQKNVIQVLKLSNPEKALLHLKSARCGSFLIPGSAVKIRDPIATGYFPGPGIEKQIFLIFKNESRYSFTIKRLEFNFTNWDEWIDYSKAAYPVSMEILSDLRIWRPYSLRTTCLKENLTVEHGKVENPDRVPFFLRGSRVRVRCDPGYGVAALNYTDLQEVTCSDHTLVQPCSSLKTGETRMGSGSLRINLDPKIFIMTILSLSNLYKRLDVDIL